MRPIPKELRNLLELEPRMKKCLYCSSTKNIEFHHALHYRTQLNEFYAIQPLCTRCHRGKNGSIDQDAKEYCEFVSITLGLEMGIEKDYPRRNWRQRLKALQSKMRLL